MKAAAFFSSGGDKRGYSRELAAASVPQASLWVILEAYNVPDMDLLKSLYEQTTRIVRLVF